MRFQPCSHLLFFVRALFSPRRAGLVPFLHVKLCCLDNQRARAEAEEESRRSDRCVTNTTQGLQTKKGLGAFLQQLQLHDLPSIDSLRFNMPPTMLGDDATHPTVRSTLAFTGCSFPVVHNNSARRLDYPWVWVGGYRFPDYSSGELVTYSEYKLLHYISSETH